VKGSIAPAPPARRYRVVAELPGFKRFERTGITLEAGEVGVVNVTLQVGPVAETLPSRAKTPRRPARQIDLGRTLSDNEIQTCRCRPATVQLCVPPGQRDRLREHRVRRAAHQRERSQMHTNYQLDGNTNTEKDRAGLRMLPMSEVLVREVKVITNGFAPEFGQTTGMVYNAITPSGTNSVHGSASFRFKRNRCPRSRSSCRDGAKAGHRGRRRDGDARRTDPQDKWHYYGAYEFVDRSLVTGGQVITVTPAERAGARASRCRPTASSPRTSR
jgi:hypothetical protein